MISVFFNGDGYHITGNGINIARRCTPATTIRGDKIFQPIHHTYKILHLALCELRNIEALEDVIVYNDSRIIDELNKQTEPLDETCQAWVSSLKRNIIPSIASIIFFRKKPTSYINNHLESVYQSMLTKLDKRDHDFIIEKEKTITNKRKNKLVEKLKRSWFGN